MLNTILACAGFCDSASPYYAWTPNQEYVYRFYFQLLSGIPDIDSSQTAGVKLTTLARVQTFSDYSLRIKFDGVEYHAFNGEVRLNADENNVPSGNRTQGPRD